ncbi:hypothetical protein Sjap_014053 [Stephania japonica]|uniref:C2H2-type domain-containing protein n=1 Tax=Stephania japonica TaxID=461633 RepID=A0AAP0P1W3_9MAGN
MAFVRPLLNSFLHMFLLLFHLGCFIFPTTTTTTNPKKRKVSIVLSHDTKKRANNNRWSYLKHLFCFHTPTPKPEIETLTIASARSSQHSLVSAITPADATVSRPTHRRRRSGSIVSISMSISSEADLDCQASFTLRNDIYPCPTCGEIFQKIHLLELHQSIKHAVSELFDGDSGKNVVQIIFTSGWSNNHNNNNNNNNNSKINIHRILKIHNSPKILARFEEYRESVKAKASRIARKRDERCVADGNELLRFHCTTFMCNLGQNGNSSLCGQQYCSVCGIIRAGFSAKIDGIATMSNSWRAHVAVPDGLEEEFGFMGVKRAMLICRVVAGRIGNDQGLAHEKDEVGFDSVVARGEEGGAHGSRVDEDELLVFNPRAVLPCFAIVYSVAV